MQICQSGNLKENRTKLSPDLKTRWTLNEYKANLDCS